MMPRATSTEPRTAALDVALEAAVALLGVLVLVPLVLRGRSFAALGFVAWRPFVPVAFLAILGLLAWRASRASARGALPGVSPGRWLAALRAPDVLLVGVFLAVLLALPVPSEPMGADSQVYLEQLGRFFLGGDPGAHPGVEPGTTLLWAPFFLLGHALARAGAAIGLDVAADGASEPYRNALRLGACLYALLAAFFAQRAAARFVSPLLAAVCAAGLWLGSSLYHYTVAEPAMAHAPAAAVSSLLLLLWLRAREVPDRIGRWVGLGLAAGLLVAIQRYDAYLLLPALLSAAWTFASRWRKGDGRARRRLAFAAVATAGAFALAVLPLVVLTVASQDSFLVNPRVIRSEMLADWAHPHVLPMLFSSNGGFLAWTPLGGIAILGLLLLARRDPRVGLTLLATLALGLWVLASNPTWWGGFSFGARRLTEAYPILVLGLGVIGEALLRRPWVPATALLGLFVAANVLLSDQMRRGGVEPDDAVSFRAVAQGAVADFHSILGHPGSWPANWIFSWTYGVSPGRFDELYGRLPRHSWAVRIGAPEDAALLGRGWSRPSGETPGRWDEADEATLLVTLPAPADRRLRLRGFAARHPQGREQSVAVTVNGAPAGSLTLTPDGRDWEVVLAASSWVRGLNEIRFRSAWRLSRKEAWAVDEPPFVGWRLETVAIEPVPLPPSGPS